MTRAEHLSWAKERALAYVEDGETQQAYASMVSDLRKHPETQNHAAAELGMMLLMGGHLSTATDMRDFILGIQ